MKDKETRNLKASESDIPAYTKEELTKNIFKDYHPLFIPENQSFNGISIYGTKEWKKREDDILTWGWIG